MSTNPDLMMGAVLGVVYQADQLTIALRNSGTITLEQHDNCMPLAAATRINNCAQAVRHFSPVAYTTGEDIELLTHWLAPLTLIPFDWHREAYNSSNFVNRGSELFHEFMGKVREGATLPVDADRELAAISASRDEPDGRIKYASPDELAASLGALPARALAILLAFQPGRSLAKPTNNGDYDPLNGGDIGHKPF